MSRLGKKVLQGAAILAASTLLSWSLPASAERIKDIASIQGVRHNQLVGYGLVVGLDNSGDQTTQTPFTSQSVINMLSQMGVNIPVNQASSIQLKNVAAVMVTASHPPFARPGQTIDITVSSIGNAKSLRGGTLLMTPLKGADGQVYAMAQGSIVVGGAGASAPGARVQVNHLSAGRIPGGATVERAVPNLLGQEGFVVYELETSDFETARRMVEAINKGMGASVAQALDGRQIRVATPQDTNARVAFMGRLENISVDPMLAPAKVVLNPRTGSIVMNQLVTIGACAISHGNLSVIVTNDQLPDGGQQSNVKLSQDGINLLNIKAGTNLAEVVKALNALGANPQDLLAILQAMKVAGALRAELEII